MIMADPAAERAVLAGLCKYGSNAFYNVCDILTSNSFTVQLNSVLYSCINDIFEEDSDSRIDAPLILSKAKSSGYNIFANTDAIDHLSAIMDYPVDENNVRKLGFKIAKLEVARKLYEKFELTKNNFVNITGEEDVTEIIGMAEEAILGFTQSLYGNNEGPQKILNNAEERYRALLENPIDQVGIPTGFPLYDIAIGGGLRRGSANVIGARMKVGKSSMSINIGYNIAKRGIPVLYLDTEMEASEQQDRLMAHITGIDINRIETGQFGQSSIETNKFFKALKESKDIPYTLQYIGGMSFESQMSIMRRWVHKEVGFEENGKAKDCLIIYDYLKLMDESDIKRDMKEYQALGFRMTALKNFAGQYGLPSLILVQLNRDGIDKETTNVISGSDRIGWFCSNFSIFKEKSEEEIREDGTKNGNRKIVSLFARNGAGLKFNEYINVDMDGATCSIKEIGLNTYLNRETKNVVQDEESIPF